MPDADAEDALNTQDADMTRCNKLETAIAQAKDDVAVHELLALHLLNRLWLNRVMVIRPRLAQRIEAARVARLTQLGVRP